MLFKKLLKNLDLEDENLEVIFLWNTEKNQKLKESPDRNFKGFEDIVIAILEDRLIDILDNPNYPNQFILVVEIDDYIYAVPAILEVEQNEEEKLLFIEFKTLYPSRKLLKKYKGGAKDDQTF